MSLASDIARRMLAARAPARAEPAVQTNHPPLARRRGRPRSKLDKALAEARSQVRQERLDAAGLPAGEMLREMAHAELRTAEPSLPPTPQPPPEPQAPAARPGWRGPCKAVNAATGRQCGLLHGHPGAHRHGSTPFVTVAITDDDITRARARMDAAAQRRTTDPLVP